MKRDPELITALRRLCATASDDDVHDFIAQSFRAAFLGGHDHARRFPDQDRDDAVADLDELDLRSSAGAH